MLHFLEVHNLTLEEENMLRVLWSGIATKNLMETMGAISCVLRAQLDRKIHRYLARNIVSKSKGERKSILPIIRLDSYNNMVQAQK